jgi:hypothetical protein
MALCNRHPDGDGTSRSVWCSHDLAPVHGNQVRTRDRVLTTPGPKRRKKRKKPLSGEVCLLTRGGLIRVRHSPRQWLCPLASSSCTLWSQPPVAPGRPRFARLRRRCAQALRVSPGPGAVGRSHARSRLRDRSPTVPVINLDPRAHSPACPVGERTAGVVGAQPVDVGEIEVVTHLDHASLQAYVGVPTGLGEHGQ